MPAALHREAVRAHVAGWVDPAVGGDVGTAAVARSSHARESGDAPPPRRPIERRGRRPVASRCVRARPAPRPRCSRGSRSRGRRTPSRCRSAPAGSDRSRSTTLPSRTVSGVPPWARTMPAARLDAPLPAISRSSTSDALRARLAGEHRGPAADRAGADDHDVRGFAWHRLRTLSRRGANRVPMTITLRSMEPDAAPTDPIGSQDDPRRDPRRAVGLLARERRLRDRFPLPGAVAWHRRCAADQNPLFANQVIGWIFGLAPVALVIHLLHRDGEGVGAIGLDAKGPWRDIARGCPALGRGGVRRPRHLHRCGLSGREPVRRAGAAAGHWWTWPAVFMNASGAAFLEEVVVLAYLITRLQQLAWSPWAIILASAAVARLLPPVSRVGRLRREPADGCAVRVAVPELAPGVAVRGVSLSARTPALLPAGSSCTATSPALSDRRSRTRARRLLCQTSSVSKEGDSVCRR